MIRLSLPRAPTGPHRRYNPLLREWVLVSPQRLARPWQGRTETPPPDQRPAYDPSCYLCPGNQRAEHARNPQYEGTFVFTNDFPALLPRAGDIRAAADRAAPADLLRSAPESGACRVVCFSPRHDLSLPQLTIEEVRRVVDVWTGEYLELGGRDDIAYVQIFENRGAAMGASNPHPHGQIWATEHMPDIPRREQEALADFTAVRGECLLCACLETELAAGERIVAATEHFVALVPFWAVWPFETLILPTRHVPSLDVLTDDERTAFAAMLREITVRYDALFSAPCPYSMGIHQQPGGGAGHPEWHLHAHFYPPVLRSATVHKFMVGFELLGNPQRDITAELAAERLRLRASPAFAQSASARQAGD